MKLKQMTDVPGGVMDALVNVVLRPVVTELAEEALQPIRVKVVACLRGKCVERELNVQSGGECASAADGEIRVLLKESDSNFNFVVEAILKGLAPGTGFSGFSVRGKLRLDEGQYYSKLSGRTNRYHVWAWSKDLRFDARSISDGQ